MRRKKEGFMLPMVTVIVALLAGLGLVMNQLSEAKLKALVAQKKSYYGEKTLEIDLVPVETMASGDYVFDRGLALNSSSGSIDFINHSSVAYSPNGVLGAKEHQVTKESWAAETCKIIGGEDSGIDDADCVGEKGYLPCEYLLTLPNQKFDEISNLNISSGSSLSYSELTNIVPGDYNMPSLSAWNVPLDVSFMGNGEYNIENFTNSRRDMKVSFGENGKYSFDKLEIGTGYSPGSFNNITFGKNVEVWIKETLKVSQSTKIEFQGGGENFVHMNKLEMESGSTITLGTGTYWIEELHMKASSTSLLVNGNVKIYVKKILVESGNYVNTDKTDIEESEAGDLVIGHYGTSSDEIIKFLDANTYFKGFIYTEGKIEMNNPHFTGNIIAKDMDLTFYNRSLELDMDGAERITRAVLEDETKLDW